MRIDDGSSVKLLTGEAGGDKPELSLRADPETLFYDSHDGNGFQPVGAFGAAPVGVWHLVELQLFPVTGMSQARLNGGAWTDLRNYNALSETLPLPLNQNVFAYIDNSKGGVDFPLPEPATIGLLTFGGLLSCMRRRRS